MFWVEEDLYIYVEYFIFYRYLKLAISFRLQLTSHREIILLGALSNFVHLHWGAKSQVRIISPMNISEIVIGHLEIIYLLISYSLCILYSLNSWIWSLANLMKYLKAPYWEYFWTLVLHDWLLNYNNPAFRYL